MNDDSKKFLEHNGEMQVAVVGVFASHPEVPIGEWAVHALLCAAALAMTAGATREETIATALEAIDLAYSTDVETSGGSVAIN